jgi:hypothetical protein
MNEEEKRETAAAESGQKEFILHPSSFILGFFVLGVALVVAAYFCRVHWGLLTTFRHVVDLRRNPYHYYGGNLDRAALGIAAGAALSLTAIGYLALHALDLYIPRLARLALAYVVGLGTVGVLLEIETIFGFYSRRTIGGTLAFVVLCFGALAEYRTRRVVQKSLAPNWGTWRAEIAREHERRYRESLCHPKGPLAVLAYGLLLFLIAIVTLLTFYHGSLCPVTYWDSLILYVGYAREIFFQRAFPFKAVAQVGIGLGANYPHLYALITAATATVAGRWSDSFAQVAPPFAGLLSCFLVYHTALRLTRHRLLALALTALFRTIPYGIAYFIYASDYSFVMLFTAAFLYVALCYLETGLVGYFILATLIPAFAMHVNYLMGLLWVVWAAMLFLTHARPIRESRPEPLEILKEEDMPRDMVASQTVDAQPPTLAQLLVSRRLWAWFIIAVAVASPWYVRNWVLTGNPVYAFFVSLFPKTVHYNQEVMDSACVEWTLNGDGIGQASLTQEFRQEFDRFRRASDVSKIEIARIQTPLRRKIVASWPFWVTGFNAWKLAPSFLGIALPGLLVFLLTSLRPRRLDLADRQKITRRRFGWLCVLLLFLLLAYHYLIADFYLYQIIPLVVLIPLFGVYFVQALAGRFERGLFIALAIWIAVFPGFPMALMGFKIIPAVNLGGRLYSPFELVALHNIGLDRASFHQLAFGEDAFAWTALNTYGLDEKILTHENRHLVLDRRVKIVHFDDWEVQALWGKSPDEQLRGLRDLGINYYLFVPNETKHQVNRRLGPPAKSDISDEQWRWLHDPTNKNPDWWRLSALRGWIENGVLEPVEQLGDNRLYRFKYPSP